MVRYIEVPVVLGGTRALFSENCQHNGVPDACDWYSYATDVCCPACTHPGHDVDCNFDPLYAATDGIVRFAGADGFYEPYHVDIEPTVGPFRGEYHIYGHMNEYWVNTGDMVRLGQQIGISGTAGTGPHLHFERRASQYGCSLSPDPVLTSQNANGGATAPSPAGFDVEDKIQVVEGPLNLRAAPSASSTVVASLQTGTQLCVIGGPTNADGYEWFDVQVISTGATGYVASQFCDLVETGGCGTPPSSFSLDDRIAVVDGPLNVRTSPSAAGTIIASLAEGTEVCVTGGPVSADGYVWYEVDASGTQGWVAGEFCRLVSAWGCQAASDFSLEDRIEVADGPLNLRTEPATSSTIVTSLTAGTDLCITGTATDADGYTWYPVRVSTTGATGFVAGEFCELVASGACADDGGGGTPTYTHVVTGSALNLRTCASTGCGTIATLPVGTRLSVISGPVSAEGYTWYHIQPEGYADGWSVNGFDPIGDGGGGGTPTYTHEVTNSALNLRTCASTGCSVVAALPIGTRLYVIAGPQYAEGYTWYHIQPEGSAAGWSVNGFDPI